MDAVDSTTNKGNAHPETHSGRREVERGMAKLTGGPGAADPSAPTGRGAPSQGQRDSYESHYQPNPEYGAAPLSQKGNVLGPSSAMTAGFTNAGPDAVAQAPYQQQYSAGGAGAPEASVGMRGTNDREFAQGQQGSSPGPAPDRYALGGEPGRLP